MRLKYKAWEDELKYDLDKNFLLCGIKNGFDIIDSDADPSQARCNNHPSAQPNSPLYAKATEQINIEIQNGNYIEIHEPPVIISPLGVIPKPDGGVRLIHDCSRPQGLSVNDYVSNKEKHKYSSVDSASKLVHKGYYMAKVDLKSAYRSVPISTKSQLVTGIRWEFPDKTRYFYDCKLPFGSSLAPGIFHRLSQAVVRMMSRRGFNCIVAYLDDFFICAPSRKECASIMGTLIRLLRKLGFMINWKKVIDPIQSITFLGIEISSIDMQLCLPGDKLEQIKEELAKFKSRKRASKKQLQSLIGKLNWASSVVYGGRVFLRRLINAMNSLKHSSHKLRISQHMSQDLHWWHSFMVHFNGKSLLLDKVPVTAVYTDACSIGAGGHWGHSWFYLNWEVDCPDALNLHINEQEVLAVTFAAHYWAHHWANKRILIFSDNAVTVSALNKGTSRNNTIMRFLRYMFWLSAKYNFHITARHIKGTHNDRADTISRLNERSSFIRFLSKYPCPMPMSEFLLHMSPASLSFLLSRHLTGISNPFSGC